MPSPPTAPAARLASIDLLRGTVMLIMLLDHVRETFYLHRQLADPVDIAQTEPALFLCRLLAHLCAPVFLLLTGLSAWLYGSRLPDPRTGTAAFLLKRGLFLVALELTLVNFAWTFEFPPSTVYLQVIWAIGLSMIALAGLLWLPRAWLAALALAIVAGHNLLDGIAAGDGAAGALWKVLHGALLLFAALRALNGYGDAPWVASGDALRTWMSVFNLTKYPPSLLFLLATLGVGLLLLRAFEWPPLARALRPLAAIGAAPMFFYLLHLYVLKALYLAALAAWGPNRGEVFGVDGVGALVAIAVVLALALYPPVAAFARLKARRRDLAWLRYL
ncbi:DUF1624 domain-containing protein [Luteimonas huabeiensis]|uniref:DUF1624 domain-containing protein n=1 Tax=Luteimonas huabeiensis TaxID=1244513 RepID=UPI000463E572|nr:heparan-alpha-glucosaminide N-acetyltransferase domain-containing protein [Luteimonas huabeiensis]